MTSRAVAEKDISNRDGWTKAKRDMAMRLYPKIIEEVASALKVPPRDLLKLWTKGINPELVRAGEQRELPADSTAAEPALEAKPVEKASAKRKQPSRPGLNDEVVAYHRKNPKASAMQIAEALDCSPGYVRATAKRQELQLPSAREASDSPPVVAPRTASVPALQRAAPPAKKRPVRHIEENPLRQAGAKRAKWYRLRRLGRDGKFLHMSGEGETAVKDHAWIGTAHQARNMRKRSEAARRMRLVAEPAWQPRDRQLARELRE